MLRAVSLVLCVGGLAILTVTCPTPLVPTPGGRPINVDYGPRPVLRGGEATFRVCMSIHAVENYSQVPTRYPSPIPHSSLCCYICAVNMCQGGWSLAYTRLIKWVFSGSV